MYGINPYKLSLTSEGKSEAQSGVSEITPQF